MAKKKSPSSLERKKVRERRERASALAAQSSVKADKKQAWWCQKKKAPAYSNLPSSQQKRLKRAEQARSEEISRQISSGEYGKRHAGETVCMVLAMILTWRTTWVGYTRWLHRWYLVGPDTLYIRYSILSLIFFVFLCLIDFVVFGAVLIAIFNAFFDSESRKKIWNSLRTLLRSGWANIWKTTRETLLALSTLAVRFLLVPHLILLLLCLSRTEVTTTGTATYFLGFQTGSHSFEELAETQVSIVRHRSRGVHGYHHALAYTMRFQDGYELEVEMEASAFHGFVHDWDGLIELDTILRDRAPQKCNVSDLYRVSGLGSSYLKVRDHFWHIS